MLTSSVAICVLLVLSVKTNLKNSEKNTVTKACELILIEERACVELDSVSPGPNSAAL